MNQQDASMDLDQPLVIGSALENDRLSRYSFAESAVYALKAISPTGGFVLSVEGAWGSGKTSSLAMIEDLLLQQNETDDVKLPIVVHFNPWLVGDRDALLRNFLARIAQALKLHDPADGARKVAREIRAYAKAFDVVKLIPGAEPWASIVKSVFETVGHATDSITEYKTPNLEEHKQRVKDALFEYPRPIIVFIDDIDRLFPPEVFEMVRIVKAVGELPNVGYVLAWDPTYVSESLKSLKVAHPEMYLDKVVQARIPLPTLSRSSRQTLFKNALEKLHPDARTSYFKGDEDRLFNLYFSGLRELLEQPRDVIRLFNTVHIIEPSLRGEVVLADIVGLAALMTKAAPLFELISKKPHYFVGPISKDQILKDKAQEIIRAGTAEREAALEACSSPIDAKHVVHFLFPLVAKCDNAVAKDSLPEIGGCIANPSRLLVALQRGFSSSDISFESVRKLLLEPAKRNEVLNSLSEENCMEFMEFLGDTVRTFSEKGISDVENLCLALGALTDKKPFIKHSSSVTNDHKFNFENMTLRTIRELVNTVELRRRMEIARKLVECESALFIATVIIREGFQPKSSNHIYPLILPVESKKEIFQTYLNNILKASRNNSLFCTANPRTILQAIPWLMLERCKEVFSALREGDPTLDNFALAILQYGNDTHKGLIYGLPDPAGRLSAYCTWEDLRAHAKLRLADKNLASQVFIAWRSVVEGKYLYAADGTEADAGNT
ncbi:KAP family P-loop NTPase fold protein [Chitinimonas sp. PSY-7]|uniref:P-loop NTPase fold protein n=1 Tax=Chitinimonas sp. PSY-7 TaxID=3459088 RepID=UPI00403FF5C3